MIVKIFAGLTKQKSLKKALDFWYKNYKNTCTMLDFFKNCTWKKEGLEYIIILRGSDPKDK